MKIGRIILRAYLCFLPLVLSAGSYATSLSTAEYRQQLQQFSARIEQIKVNPNEAQGFEPEIPDRVSVKGSSGELSLSYDWLKSELKKFEQADPRAQATIAAQIHDRLQTLDTQAQAYEQAQADPQESRKKIQQILARHEFRGARGPGFLEIWWQKLMRWLSNFFERHPIYGRRGNDLLHIGVYAAVAVAFVMFAVWITRRLDRRKDPLNREIVPFAPSAKGWRTWLSEAHASARQAGWREAIHLAYWAGISFLEEQGAWRPDRARTPREYLRMLGTRKPQYPVLSTLTRKFEVIWYGHHDASAADFQETLGQLEKLGCR